MKMNYQVRLNTGQTIDLTNAELDSATFTAALNDAENMFVNIGGAIINKHIILSIVPVDATLQE